MDEILAEQLDWKDWRKKRRANGVKLRQQPLLAQKVRDKRRMIAPAAFIGAKNERQVEENCANGNWWSTDSPASIDKQFAP